MTDTAPALVTDDFATRVAGLTLSASERRVVELLARASAYELGIMTSSDLCGRTDTSRSTIDRLSRRLGYPGLKELRRALLAERRRQDALARSPGMAQLEAEPDSPNDIARQVLASLTQRAASFADALLRSRVLDELVDAILAAGTIQLFGAGESAASCSSLYLRLVRLGVPIQFTEEGHTQVTLASLMNPGDLAIAFSYSGSTRSTVWAARAAAERGATVAAVTADRDTPLGRLATIRIGMPVEPRSFGSDEAMGRIVFSCLNEIIYLTLGRRNPELLANSLRIDAAFDQDRL